jgi:hypothetical protein
MSRKSAGLALLILLAAAMPAGAGQSYLVHGSTRPGGWSASPRSGTYHAAPQSAYRGTHAPRINYGAIRGQGRYQHYYPPYPAYPAYPVYPVYPAYGYPAYGYQRYPDGTYYQYERSGPLPSTHTYGYYDFGRRRACIGPCSGNGWERDGYRRHDDGDGRRHHDDGRDGDRHHDDDRRSGDRHCHGDC